MRQIVFGGEAAHATRLKPIFTALSRSPLSVELINAYGPAETCINATLSSSDSGHDIDRNIIPIGLPLPNYTCYILDEHLSRCPCGDRR